LTNETLEHTLYVVFRLKHFKSVVHCFTSNSSAVTQWGWLLPNQLLHSLGIRCHILLYFLCFYSAIQLTHT